MPEQPGQAQGEDAAVAVLIPCYNEAATIADVVRDFAKYLPQATIYVYDNNSVDDTAGRAEAAGAVVRREPRQGKGSVVRRMFADIEADLYVLVDGDDTYDAGAAETMVQRLVDQQLDMVVGVRVSSEDEAYRFGHRFGNRFFTSTVGLLFGGSTGDMLSGYRVFSRRFVKSFPTQVDGFEIETELTVHALELRMPTDEIRTTYRARPEGSESKLSTWKDGLQILLRLLRLSKDARPLAFFSILGALTATASVLLAIPLIMTWLDTGLVPRFPTAILCAALMVVAMLFLACGIILDTVTRGRSETRRLAYLSIPLRSSRT